VNSGNWPPLGGPFVLLAAAVVVAGLGQAAPSLVRPGPVTIVEEPDLGPVTERVALDLDAGSLALEELDGAGPIEPLPVKPPRPLSPREERQALALARICVSEAGFTLRTPDCELIYHVLRTRSQSGELELGTMRAYCTKSFNKARTDSHRWVAHLNRAGREPEGWSEVTTVPWSRRREAWLRVLEHTRDLIRAHPENPCGDRLDHWGAKGFRKRRHLRNGWRIVDCGETLNEFWALPDRPVR